jgi:methylated-DNA-protein-cysteine methyltransferase related protein
MASSKPTADFFEKVYAFARLIPKGKVSSYGRIAEALGSGIGARMVGWAMNGAHNQTPPVPAHRVVNRNGMLTGKHHFSTPTQMQEMLAAEGIEVKDDCIINFEQHLWQP